MPQVTRKEKKKISLRQSSFKGKGGEIYFPREALFYAFPKGSMTLEASLILPLFLFAAATILSFFLMMQAQYAVGNALDQAVSEASLLAEASPGEVKTLVKAGFYKELAVKNCPLALVRRGMAGFSFGLTKVDNEIIDACVSYSLNFPIKFFGIKEMKVADARRMHRWTGRQTEGENSHQEEWVFVTPAQTVYHVNRSCSHLKLSIEAIKPSGVQAVVSSYSPCGHCTKKNAMGAFVYIARQGDCYHYSIDCSGLKRTVYMIKKSQANGKRPCSRCGGKK